MYKFGEIYFAKLPVQIDSRIQQGYRPVLVVSNDKNNYYSTVLSVVPLTSSKTKHQLPTHVELEGFGLIKPSVALCEQIMPIDKHRLGDKIGVIDNPNVFSSLQRAMMVQLNMAS